MPRRKGLDPTKRDKDYLSDLGEVVVMSTEMIYRRHYAKTDTTGKGCLRRLAQIEAHDLTKAVSITACFGARSAMHTIHRLTPTGADFLAFHTGTPPPRMLRTDPKAETLAHRLLIAQTMLNFTDAALVAGCPRPKWLLEHDRRPDAPRDVPEPQQYIIATDYLPLPTSPTQPIEIYGPPRYDDPSLILVKARPDAASLLTIPGQSSPLAFVWEIDNATETHHQLLSKLPGLHALLTRHEYRYWPESLDVSLLARVMFLFTSAERLKNVLERLRADPTVLWRRSTQYKPNDADRQRALKFLEEHFRFALLADLSRPNLLEQSVWRTVCGQGGRAIYQRNA